MAEETFTRKSKVVLEYPLNATTIQMIWDSISTPPGLTSWFADSVTASDGIFTFRWGKHEDRKAELINSRQNTYVRYHWLDDIPDTYFEIRIVKNEMTESYSLIITDFALHEEEDDIRSLWNSSIEALHRCGL